MKKVLNSILVTSALVLLTACGGGSDEPDGGGTTDGGGTIDGGGTGDDGTSVNGVSPITPFTESISRTFTIAGTERTYTYETGYDGNISSDLSLGYFSSKLEGIDELVINDAHTKISVDYSCTNGDSVKATVDEDFSTGKVVYSGTVNGTPVSCTDTYDSPLPHTITAADDVVDFIDDWTDDDPISSTCPDDLDDEVDTPFDGSTSCTGSYLTNTTIEDNLNKTHKISQKISF